MGVSTRGDTFTQSSGDQKDFNPDGSDTYHYSPSSNSGLTDIINLLLSLLLVLITMYQYL